MRSLTGGPMDELWQAVKDPALLWRSWDDEIVLYNSGSGDLYRLTALAAETFERLNQGAVAVATLKAEVAEALALARDAAFEAQIDAILDGFRLGRIIERVPP